jgi:glycosyltransferase involved in cell wall biosynthesis
MEETLGTVRYLCESVPVPVVVKLHGPWFINGEAMGVAKDRSFAKRVSDEGLGISVAAGVSAPSLDLLRRTRSYYGLDLADASVIPCSMASRPKHQRWRLERRDPNRIVFIGRFDRHKGGDVMIDAFALLAKRFAHLRLDYIGPDRGIHDATGRPVSLSSYIESQLPNPYRERITVHGEISNSELDTFRREASVTVAPSRYENLPYSVLEAMAVGAPLVTSRVGGIPELISDGRNGLLAEAGDAADLARQIANLIENPGLAASLGEAAAVDCEARFSPRVIAGQTLDFYEQVIARWACDKRGDR